MTKRLTTLALLSLFTSYGAYASSTTEANTPNLQLDTETKKTSYSMGVILGQRLPKDEDLDSTALMQGIYDSYNDKELKLSPSEIDSILKAFQQKKMQEQAAQQQQELGQQKQLEQSLLDEHAKKENVNITESGLQYTVTKQGTGVQPKKSDEITLHYKTSLLDGTLLESSYDQDDAVTFTLSDALIGWQEALMMMKEGGEWKVVLPSKLAYGAGGTTGIKPYTPIAVEFKLIKVNAK